MNKHTEIDVNAGVNDIFTSTLQLIHKHLSPLYRLYNQKPCCCFYNTMLPAFCRCVWKVGKERKCKVRRKCDRVLKQRNTFMMTALNDEQRTVIKKLSSVSLIPLSSSHAVSMCICEREKKSFCLQIVLMCWLVMPEHCVCACLCVCVLPTYKIWVFEAINSSAV